MSTHQLKSIGMILLLCVGLVGSPLVTATTLSIEPASNVVSVGDNFTLDIKVTDVTDLFSFQFDIGFSPSILSATAITEGAFLPSGGSTFFIPGTIENVLGTISFTGDTLLSAPPGVSGSGVIATLSFHALSAGTSAVNLSNIILLDSTLADIAFSSQNGSVDVQAGSQVPTPETLLLLFPGLAGLWFSQRAVKDNKLLPVKT